MCGRFALHVQHNAIRQVPDYDVEVEDWVDEEHFYPRYNVAPHTVVPVVRRAGQGSAQDSEAGPSTSHTSSSHSKTIMQSMEWGVTPHWAKAGDRRLNTINARADAIVEGGGMWGSLRNGKRCVVIAQGYYEWLKGAKGKPYFIKRGDGRLMLFAGLYDCYQKEGESEPRWSCAIVTTEAAKSISWLHDRMPVILSNTEELDLWLDTSSSSWTNQLSRLVESPPDLGSSLITYPVPPEVGAVGNESPSFIEPVSERKDGLKSMFARQKEPKKNNHVSSPSSSQSSLGTSAAKRERSPSPPTIDLTDKDEPSVFPSPIKKRKVSNDDAHTPSSSPQKKKKASSPTKRGKDEASDGSAKITTFFSKK